MPVNIDSKPLTESLSLLEPTLTKNRGVSVSAQRIPLHSVLRAPAIRHLPANLPKLGEKLMTHAILENLDRPPLERLGTESNRPVNQLHVLVSEFLEQFVEFRQLFGHHVRIPMVVLRIVDLFDRKPMLVQIIRLERIPDRLVHLQQ